MLLAAPTRQIFVDLGYEAKACLRLKNDSRDDEFLVSRVLFLLTYDSNVNIEKLIDESHLADTINQNLARHAKLYVAKSKKAKEDPMEDMALTETLKLMFNLTHFCPQRCEAFSPSIPHILTILSRRPIPPIDPLGPPMGALVNALINLELENKKCSADATNPLFPKGNHSTYTEHLLSILATSIDVYAESDLEAHVSPLLTLLRKIYEHAPPDVRTLMQDRLLPSDTDRAQPLGRTASLPSRLLRLSTSSTSVQLKEAISNLLFDMSDKDAASFVQNVGYGFASGFLFQHNVPIPENALEAWSTSGGTDGDVEKVDVEANEEAGQTMEKEMATGGKGRAVNPITGQLLDMEAPFEGKEMTQAEKEREAEKLMVLFERSVGRRVSRVRRLLISAYRLRKNGVITAENPMRAMQQEGRFEELADDDDEDID